MINSIVPSRLYKCAQFESRDTYVTYDGGRLRIDALCTPSLESQINEWVDRTKNLVTGTGPIAIVRGEHAIKRDVIARATKTSPESWTTEVVAEVDIRSVMITYVPAVEQPDVKLYGDRSGPVQTLAANAGSSAAGRTLVGVPGTARTGGQATGRAGGDGSREPGDHDSAALVRAAGGRKPLRVPTVQ